MKSSGWPLAAVLIVLILSFRSCYAERVQADVALAQAKAAAGASR